MSALSRAARVMRNLLRLTAARLYIVERMLEAPLRQVDIIDGFVNKLVIDCVNFCKTGCVFTGGQEDHAGE